MKQVRAPFPYYGGKHYLAKKIIALFPPHTVFLDAFGGAGNIILNKKPSKVDVWNDINKEIYNFFCVLRDRPDELIEKLRLTPYHRAEFVACLELSNDPVEQARRTFVKLTQGFSGKQRLSPGSWKHAVTHSCRGMSGAVSQYNSTVENLTQIVERIKRVQFECLPAIEAIRKYDTDSTLIYCDPPYLETTRVGGKAYDYEMTEEEHIKLAEVLHQAEGRVILSGYDSGLYRELYSDWHRVEFEARCFAQNAVVNQRSKCKRKEVVWMNFGIDAVQNGVRKDDQLSLFDTA